MPLSFHLDLINIIPQDVQLQEILEINDQSAKYGLTLTHEDALEIIETRNLALQNYGRVELDMDAVHKLISVFCSSPLIIQEDYALILKDLLELFYYLKNEN